MAEKNGFDLTKFIFQNMCVWQWGAVVKKFLALADAWGRLPATLFSVSLYPFFLSLCFFSPIFPFGLFFFIRTADPADHALGSIYILSFSPELYFRKGTKLVHQKLF